MKRSQHVTLVLSTALSASLWGTGCRRQGPTPPVPQSYDPVFEVSTNLVYTNNHYIRNVGYYHAPYGGWFPYPYNFFHPSWGYYGGGLWRPNRFDLPIQQSSPNKGMADSANAAILSAWNRARTPPTRPSTSSRTTWRSSSPTTTYRPSSASPSSTRKSTPSSGGGTSRGGFGSSSHSTSS